MYEVIHAFGVLPFVLCQSATLIQLAGCLRLFLNQRTDFRVEIFQFAAIAIVLHLLAAVQGRCGTGALCKILFELILAP